MDRERDFPWVVAVGAPDDPTAVRVTVDPSFEFDPELREEVWRRLRSFRGERLTQECLEGLERSLSSLLREAVLRGRGWRKRRDA